MRRTEWLQETRKMRFEEAFGDWQKGRLTQEEAARLLGVCTTHLTFLRLPRRFCNFSISQGRLLRSALSA